MSVRFTCADCGEEHEGLPDAVYDRPSYANDIPAEDASRLDLTSDLCVIDKEHFFVRCVLYVPIRDTTQTFGWGVWSTLSKENFRRYWEHYDEDMSDWEPMSGYLANRLPEYPDTLALKLSVQPGGKGSRPTLTLEPTDHPLAIDQREGMDLGLALRIAAPFLHQR